MRPVRSWISASRSRPAASASPITRIGEETANQTPRTGSGSYAAFISYSRAVDGKLAPALQSALHQFAKPWYRLRAVRVFRDDASLSTNPGLWSSIQTALAASDFFILLASPESARSEWVNKETGYWVANKPVAHVLIVLTAGEIVWEQESGDFDWQRTTALSPSLQGKLVEEPRYLDLRWARTEQHVSLRDGRFRDSVADIATALHGRPKDELVGDDVRQHRRALRLARSAVAVLATLALLAATLAVTAVAQRNEARKERNIANDRARLATSRQLSTEAASRLGDRLDLALLLSVQALRTRDTFEARSALLTGLEKGTRLAAVLQDDSGTVGPLAFSPNGETLAAAKLDNSISLWDMKTRQPKASLIGNGANASSLAFSRDGKILISGNQDSTTTIWDVGRAHLLGAPLASHSKPVSAVAVNPRNSLVASAGSDGTVLLKDLHTRRSLGQLNLGPGGNASSVAFSPSGRLLATAADDVLLWDTRTHQRVGAPLVGHRASVNTVAFSPDGKTLASSDYDSSSTTATSILLWNMKAFNSFSRTLVRHHSRINSLAFNPTGDTLAVGGDADSVVFWNVHTGQSSEVALRGRFNHMPAVSKLAFSPDARVLAVGSPQQKRNVILLDAQTRQFLTRPLRGDLGGVAALAFSPNSKLLASTSGGNSVILLRSVPSGERLGAPLAEDERAIKDLAFSPSGSELASAGNDGNLILWDVANRQRVSEPIGASSLPFGVTADSVAFSPDGKLLASGTSSGQIILWSLPSRRRAAELTTNHHSSVNDLTFNRDGKTLVSSDASGSVQLWDMERRQLLGEVGRLSDLSGGVAFSADGQLLASADSQGRVLVWNMSSSLWQQRACEIANRNLTRLEWAQFGPASPYQRTCPQFPAGR